MYAAITNPQHPGCDLRLGGADQVQIVSGDQDRFAHLVQINQQAQQAAIQARSAALSQRADTLKYRQDGVEVLKNLARNLGTVNARAAAGSIDPFSGSVDNLVTANLEKGLTDFYTSKKIKI